MVLHADGQQDKRDHLVVVSAVSLRILAGVLPDGSRVDTDSLQAKPLNGTLANGIDSIAFRGHVTVVQNGLTMKADEAVYDAAKRELALTGNVRELLAAPTPGNQIAGARAQARLGRTLGL